MQSNFVSLLNFEFKFILIEKPMINKKKGFPKNFEKPSPKPNYIYENYCFTNSKYAFISTSFATPAPVGSYFIL